MVDLAGAGVDLIDTGQCSALCVFGLETGGCKCRCGGRWHAYLRTGTENAPRVIQPGEFSPGTGRLPRRGLADWQHPGYQPVPSFAALTCEGCGTGKVDPFPSVMEYIPTADPARDGARSHPGWAELGWLVWLKCINCGGDSFIPCDAFFIRQWGVRKWYG